MSDELLRILESIKKIDTIGQQDVNENVLLIDGLNSFIRGFSCSPAMNDDGVHIGGISGFLRTIAVAIRQFKPTRCMIIFDGKNSNKRRQKIFSEYKSRRIPRARLNRTYDFQTIDEEFESMQRQLFRSAQYIENLPLTVMVIDNLEADDVISYISVEVLGSNQKNKSVIISSTDKDYLQLVDERIKVWNPTRKLFFNPSMVEKEYGIPTHNFLMYKMLDGDKSDNIPGIRGIGLKTIQKKLPILISEERVTVDKLFEYITLNNDGSKIYESVLLNKKILDRNYKLMQLKKINIPNRTKMRIIEIMNNPINIMNPTKFRKMMIIDKMYSSIPNVEVWLRESFNFLNSFALQTQDS